MKRVKPIKPFRTIEEEAKFWDTHDVSSLLEDKKTPLVNLPHLEEEKEEVLTVRMQKSVKGKIARIAQSMGINPSTLSRMWLIEKVREFEKEYK